MMNLLLVAFGGAVGSVARYGTQRLLNTTFPTGTLVVNLIGCFLIGVLAAFLTGPQNEQKRLFLMTGLCGGFTTFSAFSLEGLQMITGGRWVFFFLYAISSVAFGLLATFLGFKLFN